MDRPAAALQLPGDVDILRQVVIRPPADIVEGTEPEGDHHARDGEDAPIEALRALDQPDRGREFAHLQQAEKRGTVADARVAGDGAKPRAVAEAPHQPGDAIRMKDRIAIDADEDLPLRHQGAGAQRHGLALVLRQVNHAQRRDLAREAVQHLGGAVARSVIDGDDLEIRIGLGGAGADRLLRVVLLIVAGDEDRHARRVLQRRRHGLPLRAAFMEVVEDQPAHHPDEHHQQRPVAHEGKEGRHHHGEAVHPAHLRKGKERAEMASITTSASGRPRTKSSGYQPM